jgi:hypothetical protein
LWLGFFRRGECRCVCTVSFRDRELAGVRYLLLTR